MPYKFKKFVQPYIDPLRAESANILNERFVNYFAADTELDNYLADLQTATFDADQEQANSMKTKYSTSLDQRVQRGDYENLGSAVMMDARNFVKEYTPLQKNYATQIAFNQSLQKQVADGTITPETAVLAMQRDVYNYNQAALTKGVHQYTPSTVSEDIPNLVKYFEDNYLKGYIKRNYEEDTEYFTEDGVYKVRTKEGIKDFIPQSDLQLMYNNMLADPKVQSYLTQYADLRTFNLDDQTLAANKQETITSLSDAYMEMQDKFSTMRPTAERQELAETMRETKQTLDALNNSSIDEYKTLLKQGLIEQLLTPAQQTINAKYAGERNVTRLIEQSYSPLYLKKIDHQYAQSRAYEKYLYDISLKQMDIDKELREEEAEALKKLQEYRDLLSRSAQDTEEGNSFLETRPGESLSSEEQLDLLFTEGYENMIELSSEFNMQYGETSKIKGTVYTTDGQLVGNSIDNLPDGSYTVVTEGNKIENVAIVDGKPIGGTTSKYNLPISDPAYDTIADVIKSADKHLEAVMSVDPESVEDPLERAKLVEMQKTMASQYNDLVLAGAVNKEFSAIEQQTQEQFLIQDKEVQKIVELGHISFDSPLYQTGPGGKASQNDVKLIMSTALLGSANNLDLYIVNGPKVSKVSPDGTVVEDLSFTDIPQHTKDETFRPSGDGATSELIIPGISEATSGEGVTRSQIQAITKAPKLENAFVSVFNELHKGDFYGQTIHSPDAVRKLYRENVAERAEDRTMVEEIEERTRKIQQEFVRDFVTKGTNLGGIEGMVPASTPEGGAKEALSNTKAYLDYLKKPQPGQKVYELFDPQLNSEVQEYQLFLENGEFNVNLVDEDGNVLPGLSLGDIFGTNPKTGEIEAFMVPGSIKSEVQIPPVNKRGISVVYQKKGTQTAGEAKRVFIPYENLPATLPQIKERLYNEGLQYVAQKWNQAMTTGRDLDLLLNPILAGKPIDVETEEGNYIFAGKVRFSPMAGKISYLDINGNPIPGSQKDYNDWVASLNNNTLNIIDQFFNK